MPNSYELCLTHARAGRAMRAIVSEQLEMHKLTMMEWLALGVISGGSKQGLSMTNIASALDVTLPQVTALVANLTTLKLVKQKVFAQDRRGRQVTMTLKGSRTLSKLESVVTAAIKKWTAEIPGDQLQTYALTLKQLANG